MKTVTLLLFIAYISFFTSCGNPPTTQEETTTSQDSLTQTTPKPAPEPTPTIIEDVYVCPKYGFEVSLSKTWLAKPPYEGTDWEVFPKTTTGYDASKPIKIGLPILMLPIAEWEGYVKTDFSNYPYSAGGADPMESGRNNKYVLVHKNRWQMVYEDAEPIEAINAVLGTVKVVEVK